MFKQILSIITTKLYTKFWLKILILVSLVMFFVIIYNKKYGISRRFEGLLKKIDLSQNIMEMFTICFMHKFMMN